MMMPAVRKVGTRMKCATGMNRPPRASTQNMPSPAKARATRSPVDCSITTAVAGRGAKPNAVSETATWVWVMEDYEVIWSGPVADAIDAARAVVRQIERAVAPHDEIHRPPPGGAALEPAGGEVLNPGRPAVPEAHAHHLVAGGHGAVPRAVQGHEEAAAILRRELGAGVEGQAEWRRVRLDLHGGRRHAVTARALLEPIVGDRLAGRHEAVGPTVEVAVAHLGDHVGRQVVAAPVALVHGGPQRAGARLECEAHRVAEAGGEDAAARAVAVVAQHRGPPLSGLAAHVAGGAHRDVDAAVGAEDRGARPVPAARGQARHDHGGLRGLHRGRVVTEALHARVLRHVERAVAE